MYSFERQKGESVTAYSSFVNFREGKLEQKNIPIRKRNQIEIWKNKWQWDDRKRNYEEFLSSAKSEKKMISNSNELQETLAELKTLLTDRIRESETEELSADNLAKLISVTSKAITDIIKTERELTTHTKDDTDWGEVANKIRNNPEAMKLADKLNELVF